MKHAAALLFVLLLLALFSGTVCAVEGVKPAAIKRPVPVVHITDLYRPHEDPDDHWDLATQYALAVQGDIKLVAIVLDYPNQAVKNPDIGAVAQLNYLTGMAVPAMTGIPESFPLDADMTDPAVRNAPELSGVRALHRILKESPEPVVITVTGWCRDLIFIYRYDPELFVKKCAAIYLNAGLGAPDPKQQGRLEWNALIDPVAYQKAFKLPVPVYWLPCFHTRDAKHRVTAGPSYESFYMLRQSEILPALSAPVQNYFLSMFRDGGNQPGRSDWLTILNQKPDQALLKKVSQQGRCMWCTAGMLHMVGKTVLPDGRIVPIDSEEGKSAVFRFRPIRIECDKESRTSWKFKPTAARGPFILEAPAPEAYRAAMPKALKSLLLKLNR